MKPYYTAINKRITNTTGGVIKEESMKRKLTLYDNEEEQMVKGSSPTTLHAGMKMNRV